MKAKTLRKDKVNIITLGCSKNMVDSEVLSGQLKANEIDVVHESGKKDHNIVIVNTCGFIDKAKEESINTILDQVNLKQKGKLDKVYVTGCLSQRYREDQAQPGAAVYHFHLTTGSQPKTWIFGGPHHVTGPKAV